MFIRKANENDIDGIIKLLYQVNQIHADGRPDLFKSGGTKYNKNDLMKIFGDNNKTVFVADDENEEILGYIICFFEETEETNSLNPIKTLYIDDLCVDENTRGKHIGRKLYEYVADYAKKENFYRITLHAWECNPSAVQFYKNLGLSILYTAMEQIL